MFRRFVLIASSLLTLVVLGLWIAGNIRGVTLDELGTQVEQCRKRFKQIDDELYAAVRAERDPATSPGPHRAINRINAELMLARAESDAAYIRHAEANRRFRATGIDRFDYPVQWDLSRFDQRWCVVQIADDRLNLTFNSADTVPIRANWSPDLEMQAMAIGRLDSGLLAGYQDARTAFSSDQTAPPDPHVVSFRATQRRQSAERLLDLLLGEGFFFNYTAEPTREVILQIPLWFLVVLFGAFPTYTLIARRVREEVRLQRGQCLRCGYNLTGNTSGVCPECGTRLRPEVIPS